MNVETKRNKFVLIIKNKNPKNIFLNLYKKMFKLIFILLKNFQFTYKEL